MLRKVKPWRHAVAGLSVAGVAGLAGFGLIGAGDQAMLRPEHFDAKQVTVSPAGGNALRIREVIDIDFGVYARHGYQRNIPTDFGVPADLVVSAPDANGGVSQLDLGSQSRIRIGSPTETFTGQHRYILEYTLPQAQLSKGVLALDIIGTDETFVTDRFEVVLSGFELSDTTCDAGRRSTFGGCELVRRDNGDYVTVIEPLAAGSGITVGGIIQGLAEPQPVVIPTTSERNPSGLRPLGLAMIPAGLLASGAVFVVSRRYGRNEVRAGGAAGAAYGDLPAPRAGDPIADVPTYRVPDSRLAELATIEFVPPRGVEPWQAAVLLSERVDDDSVSAWFSEMIAREALEIETRGVNDVLRRGDGDARLSQVDRKHLSSMFSSVGSFELGEYNKTFTKTWTAIRNEQKRFIADSGWWQRGAPGGSFNFGSLSKLIVPLIFVLVVSAGALRNAGKGIAGAVSSPAMAAIFAAMTVGVVAFLVYRTMLPSRSATGSALTLRSESFRRFLVASEGRHVEWAWENNVLREYSAWAVALGAADAWGAAVNSSNIPHPDIALRGPLLMHTSAGSFRSARTPPSSSGSGGSSGGGFSSGVGGGGGGGSSGSW